MFKPKEGDGRVNTMVDNKGIHVCISSLIKWLDPGSYVDSKVVRISKIIYWLHLYDTIISKWLNDWGQHTQCDSYATSFWATVISSYLTGVRRMNYAILSDICEW